MDRMGRGLVGFVYLLFILAAAALVLWAPVRVWGVVAALVVLTKGVCFHLLVQRARRLPGRRPQPGRPADPDPSQTGAAGDSPALPGAAIARKLADP